MFDGLVVQAPARRVGEVEIFTAREVDTGVEVEAHVLTSLASDSRAAWFARVREVSLIRSPGLQAIDHLGHRADGAPYFVVSAQSGRTLGERLTCDGPLAGSQVLAIAHELIVSLTLAHQHGLAHGGLTLEACICMDIPDRHEAILLCGLASNGGRATQATIQADLGALCDLLGSLLDPAKDPELVAVIQQAANCPGFTEFAQMLDRPRRRRASGHHVVVVGALLGLMASAVGVSWWLSQR